MSYGHEWRPYVSVGQRRAQAILEMGKLRTKGVDIQPIKVNGRQIARTFWGKAWCTHLEKFSDFENRLPRGRTYVRNGSVCHLAVRVGAIEAKVSGSQIYDVQIKMKSLSKDRWGQVRKSCAGQIGSLLELLQGRLSDHVMGVVTDKDHGLFPGPNEIEMDCSCPDWAGMCKHVAAVMYGIGARLDEKPELLFTLRGVDHTQLVREESAKAVVAGTRGGRGRGRATLKESDLADVFGIDVAPGRIGEDAAEGADAPPAARGRVAKRAAVNTDAKKKKKKTSAKRVAATSPAARKPH